HAIGFDLMNRADAAGARVLMLTMDTPTRTTRPREVKSGIMAPFRLSIRLRLDALSSPSWMLSMFRNGIPRFASFKPYLSKKADIVEATRFVQREGGGAFTWEEVARYRDKWKKPMVAKGILHPKDAERAVSLGLDGIVVTNHGGRQIEALPASIDVLPEIASAVGNKITIIFDSGIRSGIDVARAIAVGADAAFAGKAFLWSLGALGEVGPKHLGNTFIEELASTLGQLGCETVSDLHGVQVRHPTAYWAKT
ncbi:MAG: alpha-hydroxy acid oxidase, partial [Dehalococcoidales bacterium]|nr:alpha-hydroxy acid oxidase [Dehalococcoidales bacterium]